MEHGMTPDSEQKTKLETTLMSLLIKKNIPNARARRRRALIIEAILIWLACASWLWLILGH